MATSRFAEGDNVRGIDIETWNRESAPPLSSASISAALADRTTLAIRGGRDGLDIPLDLEAQKSIAQERREARALKAKLLAGDDGGAADDADVLLGYTRRRASELRRRDSLKRREALLKGKEGSRRRQKWENDRLLGNPAFQPPEPHDWAPHPTHPVQDVPYLLAPLWDEHYAKVSRLRVEKEQSAARASGPTSQIPKNLKEKLKRARGAKTLLQDLEEQVRSFVREWEERQRLTAEGWDIDIEGSDDDIDASGEEEVVFVGRDTRCRRRRLGGDGEARNDKLVFDSPADDQGASFGRWLVHSIATYYNLRTWSVTTGDPARREAYVGIPDTHLLQRGHLSRTVDPQPMIQLPRPLYVMV